jgi:drug/metabolite transporter (DMT)-like permease
VLTYLFAALAACANATASVLQRRADADEPVELNLSLRLILDLLRRPLWLLGVLAVMAGFLLQALALSRGALAVVEPVLVFELPVTLVLAARIFHRRLRRREWSAAVAITIGLAGLLYFLAPSGGTSRGVKTTVWVVGIAANLALVAGMVLWARRSGSGSGQRAALLGVATGASFGLTAALMKAMTQAYAKGFANIFVTWQMWAMIAAGILAMFLLQSSLNAGPLVAAQPGITAADPVVSIVWGVVAFDEQVRGGLWLLLVVASAALAAWGVAMLSRSKLISGQGNGSQEDPSEPPSEDSWRAPPSLGPPAPTR